MLKLDPRFGEEVAKAVAGNLRLKPGKCATNMEDKCTTTIQGKCAKSIEVKGARTLLNGWGSLGFTETESKS